MSTAEIKERATYKSGVDLNPSADSIEEIPDASWPTTPRLVDEGGNTFIYFDLETTGLGNELYLYYNWQIKILNMEPIANSFNNEVT